MLHGVFGPWQIITVLFLFVVPLVIVILVFTSRAKHKARAETLDSVINESKSKSDVKFDQLEKLNKLRESGALTEEGFQAEKKKILG